MIEYNGLIEKIADNYNIRPGTSEDGKAWMARVVYSLAGVSGLASLYDRQEGETCVSIVHIKNRIADILTAMGKMYAGTVPTDTEKTDAMIEEIYALYQRNGYLYHCPNRVIPCMHKEASFDGITFVRDDFADDCRVSGIGLYRTEEKEGTAPDIFEMFCIDKMSLTEYLDFVLSKAEWIEGEINEAEYLRLIPPFTDGYWGSKPDRSGRVSLLRSGTRENIIYYLYRFEGQQEYTYRLEDWITAGPKYRKLANALLKSRNTLPPIKESPMGDIVRVSFDYLPADDILQMVKLFSWPEDINKMPSNFAMFVNSDIWKTIKALFETLGY